MYTAVWVAQRLTHWPLNNVVWVWPPASAHGRDGDHQVGQWVFSVYPSFTVVLHKTLICCNEKCLVSCYNFYLLSQWDMSSRPSYNLYFRCQREQSLESLWQSLPIFAPSTVRCCHPEPFTALSKITPNLQSFKPKIRNLSLDQDWHFTTCTVYRSFFIFIHNDPYKTGRLLPCYLTSFLPSLQFNSYVNQRISHCHLRGYSIICDVQKTDM